MKSFAKFAPLFALLLIPFSSTLATAAPTYSNPVLPGDFADPSVVRVGEDYWATATSSEWAPLFPILHSKDLVNWELTGHIFNKKPDWSEKHYWAPEISYYKGKFYAYYVGWKKPSGPLSVAVATADKATGPWTDHGPLIGQPAGSIDGQPVVDENGQRYLIWKEDGNSRKEPTPVWIQPLSEDGTKLTGEMKELLRNDAAWEGQLIEGPFVVKRDGWYYLFYSGKGCCGTGCDYALGVARSKKLTGPYEKNPANPILADNEKWKCPGHGSIVTTADGRDYLLYHAYDTKDFVFVGRQGVLDEVKWSTTPDSWPTIGDGKKGVSVTSASPHGKVQRNEPEFSDDFTSSTLGLRWQWPHILEPSMKIEKGALTLTSPETRGTNLFGSILAVQTTDGNYATTALVDMSESKAGSQAGIFAVGDVSNALGVTLQKGKATVIRLQKGKTETLASIDVPDLSKTYLRMEANDGHKFHFSVWDGRNWLKIGDNLDLEGRYLPPWDRGVRIGLTIGGVENASVKFDWLRVVPK